jgi:hypothetical protein
MRHRARGLILFGLTVIVATFSVVAQDATCPLIVEDILATAGDACGGLGRNQACYGNNLVTTAWSVEDAPEFVNQGDIADITQLRSMITSPLDAEMETWGVALLSLQANLPDTLPGQNVTFVLYGDTEITNQVVVDDSPRTTLTAGLTAGINVRSGPGTNFVALGIQMPGDELTLIGRNAAGDWAQIQFEDGTGWVFAPLLSIDGNVFWLPIVNAGVDPEAYTTPMQAFRLRTGIGQSDCADVPQDGLLAQSPDGTRVNFLANGVEVSLGSTAYFTAKDEDELTVSVLEGMAEVTSDDETQTVEAGYSVTVSSSAPPDEPEIYDSADVQNAPLDLLPKPISAPIVIHGVDGSAGWVDSGIELEEGQGFTVTAAGIVSVWPGCSANCENNSLAAIANPGVTCPALCAAVTTGPGGSASISALVPSRSEFFVSPNENIGALLGRVGEGGAPFLIGAGGTFAATSAGTLQFHINEDSAVLGDEVGAFVVQVTVGETE